MLRSCLQTIQRNPQGMSFIIKSKQSRVFIPILWTLTSFVLQAQVVQTEHMEVPIQSDTETYSVVSLNTSGIMLYRRFTGHKEDQIELTRLDTSLHQVWKGFLPVPKGLNFASAKVNGDKVFFFFTNPSPGDIGFYVKTVNVKDGFSLSYSIKNLFQFNATEFIASNDAILIGGYFKKFRPIVLHYSMKELSERILPGFLNEPGELTQIKSYPDGDLDVIVRAKNNKRIKCLWVRHFDSSGNLVKTVVLESEEHKNLISGKLKKLDNDIQVIVGVYGKNSERPSGIFVAEINSYDKYVIRYYNFDELQNFKKMELNYRFTVHEIVPCGDQFIMLGVFYPVYSFLNFYGTSFYSPWSFGIPNCNYNNSCRLDIAFNSFLNGHAVVIRFDKQANLIWENSVETNGLENSNLEQPVKILSLQNSSALLYLYETAEVTEQNSDGTKTEEDKVHSSKLEYWYPNHLFVYGIQDMKGKDGANRKVFFINKLSAH